MAKHSQRFVQLVDEAKKHIQEISIDQVQAKLENNLPFLLIDTREESEWAIDHLPNAIHLSKGIIERDIDRVVSALDSEIILYCGGGYRSALAAMNLQKMGYSNVYSMAGGIRAWREAGYFLVKE